MAILISRVTYIDVDGQVRTTSVVGNATLNLVEAQKLLLTNSDEASASEAPVTVNPTPTPVAATYQSVTDFAELWYLTVGGSIISLTIPAPQASVFLADQETVDVTSVAGLTAVVVGTVCTLGGDPVASFVGGIRRKG